MRCNLGPLHGDPRGQAARVRRRAPGLLRSSGYQSRINAALRTEVERNFSEARRRADDIDAGKVSLVSGEQLERQVQALFK